LAPNDVVLSSLIDAADAGERERALEELVVERVRPLVARILGRYRSGALNAHEIDDLMSAVSVRVLQRLRQLAATPDNAIEKLDDYVASLAYNIVYDFLRAKNPERVRLKNRLRYLFTHDPALALWETDRGTVCGLKRWTGEEAATIGPVTIDALDGRTSGEAMRLFFARAAAPLLFDDVVRRAAAAWGIVDHAEIAAQPEHGITDASPESQLMSRQEIASICSEVRQLPAKQRAALLLALRDANGASPLGLLVVIGLATVEALAEAAGLTVAALGDVWDDLPLDDLTIASMLGMTRQQVINLRMTARKRLLRRRGKGGRA